MKNKNKKSEAKTIKNPLALWNELKFVENIYALCVVAVIITSFLHHAFVAVNVIIISILGYIFVLLLDHKIEKVRSTSFKLNKQLDPKRITGLIQPVLKEKYDMEVTVRNDGIIVVYYDEYIFYVIVNRNSTFSMLYRKSNDPALLYTDKYQSVKAILKTAGIIIYEIQNIICVN
ncbi:MAG: hypothetical protein E7508_09030 [Ruminococcus sp.]|nr:hypothetical protein [Ruminococcus sp.]